MASLFGPAFDYLMSNEDPGLTGKVTTDDGGLTRWGISQKAYPKLNIANLKLEDAGAIYRTDYFKLICGYDIAQQRIASKLLDMAVNMGVGRATLILQSALNTTCNPPLREDGTMGPETLAACNAADPDLLLTGLVDISRQYYQHIIMLDPKKEKYRKGWLIRAEKLPPISNAVTA